MSDQTITFLVLAAVVVVFIVDVLPVAVIAVGSALLLWATGVLDLPAARTLVATSRANCHTASLRRSQTTSD